MPDAMTDRPVGQVVRGRHPEPTFATTRSQVSPVPSKVAKVGKRCVDVVVSFAALVCMAPLFLAEFDGDQARLTGAGILRSRAGGEARGLTAGHEVPDDGRRCR